MAEWRDSILENFQKHIARLTLVADPDGLLTEERMLTAIKDRGFDLIPFDDPIAFRFAYESQYRSLWDQGAKTDLVVVLRSPQQRLDSLPHDLLQAGRRLEFALHKIFPKLNYPVLASLERSHLDAIFEAYQQHDGDALTERESKEFALMHCFGIVPKLIKTPVDLLKMLLSLHSRRVHLPTILSVYLIESLGREKAIKKWPLGEILSDREAFLRFLQVEWVAFVASGGSSSAKDKVPFSHEDVRAYIDTLFLDGLLSPVPVEDVSSLPNWMRTGVLHDIRADAIRRYRLLRERFEAELPGQDASHRDWQQAAQRWAELVVLRWECDESLDETDREAWDSLQGKVEDQFGAWMLDRYGALHNLPSHQQPVMVHHIPHFLAVERTRRKLGKIALLVLDGMACDQWLLLRRHLETTDKKWRFQETTAFAWVPTVTSVTRQTIFAGEAPFYFPDSLGTTAKEKAHWQRFWENAGLQRGTVELVTSLDSVSDPKLDQALGNPRLSVLGIVWNKIDDIMHGMQMQTAGMHNQVRLWASQGHLSDLLNRLAKENFAVYVTADHGNVTATGIGIPQEGLLAETKGQRVRVYDREDFREEVATKFPESLRWPGYGLPPGRHVLLAGDLKAFTNEGERIVAHGGIALEEVLVPFVAIGRDDS
jgi:PglZ domain